MLVGDVGADTLVGGAGNDTYDIDAGDTVVERAGGGIDLLRSANSFSLADYAAIEDLSLADPKAKTTATLTGNGLANALTGDAGGNTLKGGLGKDVLKGGAGKDVFVFDTKPGSANVDAIVDFNVKDDTIKLENAVFTALKKTGALSKAAFFAGKKAHDADDRIIYDKGTGALYYDADGLGGAAQVKIATLAKKLALTSLDFVVI